MMSNGRGRRPDGKQANNPVVIEGYQVFKESEDQYVTRVIVKEEPLDTGYESTAQINRQTLMETSLCQPSDGYRERVRNQPKQFIENRGKDLIVKNVVDDLLRKNEVILAETDAQPFKPHRRTVKSRVTETVNQLGVMLHLQDPTDSCTKENMAHLNEALVEVDVIETDSSTDISLVCAVSSKIVMILQQGQSLQMDVTFYWCNFCTFKCDKKEAYLQHVLEHRFICKDCKYQSFSRAAVMKHSIECHPASVETWKSFKFCSYLPDILHRHEARKRKMSDSHSDDDTPSMKKTRVDPKNTDLNQEIEVEGESESSDKDSQTDILQHQRATSTQKAQPVISNDIHLSRSSKTITLPYITNVMSGEQAISLATGSSSSKQSSGNNTPPAEAPSTSGDPKSPQIMITSVFSLSCSYCSSTFSDQHELRTHIKSKHPIQTKRDTVSVMASDEKEDIEGDDQYHHNDKLGNVHTSSSVKSSSIVDASEQDLYKCAHCNYSSTITFYVKRHLLSYHMGVVIYALDLTAVKMCQFNRYIFFCMNSKCPFETKMASEFLEHIESCTPLLLNGKHSNSDSMLAKTLEMTKQFVIGIQENLVRQIKSKESSRYSCVYCSNESSDITKQKQHVLSRHSKKACVFRDLLERVYFCKYCLWETKEHVKYETHMMQVHKKPTYRTAATNTLSSDSEESNTTMTTIGNGPSEREDNITDKDETDEPDDKPYDMGEVGNVNRENEANITNKDEIDESDNMDEFGNGNNEREDNNTDKDEIYVPDDMGEESDESDIIEPFPALSMKRKSKVKKNQAIRNGDREVSSRTLTVQKTNNVGISRKWDKKHFCVFCNASSTNLRKHLFGPHKMEPEVQRILSYPLGSKERKLELEKIRNAGDYKHNTKVLRNGHGVLVTCKRNQIETSAQYLPCGYCLGFFVDSSLWRHKQVCAFNKDGKKSRNAQSDARLLLPSSIEVSKGLKENVISKMASDNISKVARSDPIIIKLGEKLYQKHGNHMHLYTQISQKMRELARFLLSARMQDPDVTFICDILDASKFPLAIEATKALCKYDEATNKYKKPSLALKIGHLLKKCCRIFMTEALISGSSEQASKAEEFLGLCADEWTDEISSVALQTLTANKMNKGQMLPLSEDLMKLQSNLKQNSESLSERLEKTFSKDSWNLLNQISLAQLVLFNRRRGGEAERMTIDSYHARIKGYDNPPKEVEEALSLTEKALLSTLCRVEICGKRGRTVPVLLTQSARTNIDLLLKWRNEAGVAKNNMFVFARCNFGSLKPLRSADVLRRFAEESGLKCPENVTSIRLRKHVATVCQILSLSKNDMDILANFMGHDINIHRSFYRLPQEMLQVARMGRLLTAFNNGTVGQYSGKSIDDITLDEIDDVSSASEDSDEDENHIPDDMVENTMQIDADPVSAMSADGGVTEPLSETSPHISGSRGVVKSLTIPQKGKSTIQKLTGEQQKLLRHLFQVNIIFKRELKKEECVKVQKKYECLKDLSWRKIKNTVHNWIMAEKKKV